MNIRQLTLLSLSATTALTLCTPVAAQTAPAQPVAPEQASTPAAADATAAEGDIVVYALKGARAAELQRTPAAITAVNADTIAKQQLLDIGDVGRLVPNAALSTSGSYAAFPAFQIRGVGVALSTPTVDPAVTIAVDGMPYAYPVGTNIDTFDVESLEVLRGPQGVVQGRNSTGGVVSVRSRRPTNHFEAEGQLTVGNYGRVDIGGFIAGPIVDDTILAKLSVIRRYNNGYFSASDGGTFVVAPNNPSGTSPAGIPHPKNKNESWLVRPTLVIKPTSNWTVSLLGEYTRNDSVGANNQIFNPVLGNPQSLLTLYGYTPAPGDYTANPNLADNSLVESWRGTIDTSVDFAGIGTLTSITGYRKVDFVSNLDSDTTPFEIFSFPDNHQKSTQFSQEVRFATTFSRNVDILVGAYYDAYDLGVIERRIQSKIASGGAYNQYTYQQGLSDQQEKTLAGFVNIAWRPVDRLTLTAGGRYNWEKKTAQIAPLLACTGESFAVCPTTRTNGSKSWTDFSPRASVEFQATSKLLFYASYTKGFRSGAFNSRATSALAIGPTLPESVASYEIGMKGTFFDNLLRVNLTGFHAKYADIQRTLTINQLSQLVNAASATINGVEAEITLRPAPGLEFGANLGYLDPHYISFNGLSLDSIPGNQPADDELAKKLKFPSVSNYTASLSASYSFSIPGVSPHFRLSTSYNYRSESYLDTLNVPASYLKGYGKLDASFSINKDPWTLTLFGRNINNARYYELVSTFFSAATPIEYVGFGGQPATYGVEAKVKF